MALLIVDVQRDFCPGGSLTVPRGDSIVPILNRVVTSFDMSGSQIFLTRDWHPPHHISFKERGGIWPPHCIQGTAGAEFHPDLFVPSQSVIISKGSDPDKDVYSGFEGTNLAKKLRALNVQEIFIGGLATDYCVKESSLDALRMGFKVNVMKDCVMAIELNPGDGENALQQIAKAGGRIVSSGDAIKLTAGAQH